MPSKQVELDAITNLKLTELLKNCGIENSDEFFGQGLNLAVFLNDFNELIKFYDSWNPEKQKDNPSFLNYLRNYHTETLEYYNNTYNFEHILRNHPNILNELRFFVEDSAELNFKLAYTTNKTVSFMSQAWSPTSGDASYKIPESYIYESNEIQTSGYRMPIVEIAKSMSYFIEKSKGGFEEIGVILAQELKNKRLYLTDICAAIALCPAVDDNNIRNVLNSVINKIKEKTDFGILVNILGFHTYGIRLKLKTPQSNLLIHTFNQLNETEMRELLKLPNLRAEQNTDKERDPDIPELIKKKNVIPVKNFNAIKGMLSSTTNTLCQSRPLTLTRKIRIVAKSLPMKLHNIIAREIHDPMYSEVIQMAMVIGAMHEFKTFFAVATTPMSDILDQMNNSASEA